MKTQNAPKSEPSRFVSQAQPIARKKKLSFKDQRELDGMETAIQKAEAVLASLEREAAAPEVATNATRLTELTLKVSAAQAEVDRLYARWAELGN
jgi:ATP-binding cassette subfamily F protein uup